MSFDAFRHRVVSARQTMSEGAPFVALVLGSGMGPIVERTHSLARIGFEAIPGLVPPTVTGHRGELVLGAWHGTPVLIFTGRLHFYEGHPWETVVRPVGLARELGATDLLLTNAAGGLAEALDPGALMVLSDHLEANRPVWWRQPGPGGIAGLRPSPYSSGLRTQLMVAAKRAGVLLHEGVYASVTGPSYETPAEVQALIALGADAVGMSTAVEARYAASNGFNVAAISCITNKGCGLTAGVLDHRDVLDVVARSAGQLGDVLEHWITGHATASAPP